MHEFSYDDTAEFPEAQEPYQHEGGYIPPDVTIACSSDTQPPEEVTDQPIVASENRRGDYGEAAEPPTAVIPEAVGAVSLQEAVPPVTHVEVTKRLAPEAPSAEARVIEILPQYLVVGSETEGNPELQQYIADRINSTLDRASFEGESPPTPEERAIIIKIGEAMCEIGRELGVDPSSRLLKPEHYHFFDRQEDFVRADNDPNGPGVDALYHPYKGVLLERSAPNKDFVLAHETGHSLELLRFRLVRTSAEKLKLVGSSAYTREPGDVPEQAGIREFVTEVFADRAACRIGGFEAINRKGYLPLNIIGGAIIEETAARQGVAAKAVEDMLLRGYLNGDQTGLELIGQALGKERMVRFQEVTGNEGEVGLLQIAQQLKLPRAVTSIERYIDKQPFEIFRWRPSLLRP